jgi:hypothetical protein
MDGCVVMWYCCWILRWIDGWVCCYVVLLLDFEMDVLVCGTVVGF